MQNFAASLVTEANFLKGFLINIHQFQTHVYPEIGLANFQVWLVNLRTLIGLKEVSSLWIFFYPFINFDILWKSWSDKSQHTILETALNLYLCGRITNDTTCDFGENVQSLWDKCSRQYAVKSNYCMEILSLESKWITNRLSWHEQHTILVNRLNQWQIEDFPDARGC